MYEDVYSIQAEATQLLAKYISHKENEYEFRQIKIKDAIISNFPRILLSIDCKSIFSIINLIGQ